MNKKDRIQMLRDTGVANKSLIDSLDKIGFFEVPASLKHHGNYDGGLFDHSFEVAITLKQITDGMGLKWAREQSPMIIGLFHDLCKCDQYVRVKRKNETTGRMQFAGWDYNVNTLLTGHGEKSIMLLASHMTLTAEEILCIRYHMGAYNTDEWNQYDLAIKSCPNVLWTHTADMYASKVVGI